MIKRWFVPIIAYFALYGVIKEISTNSLQAFNQWLAMLVFQPFTFVATSFIFLIGIVGYGIMIQMFVDDLRFRKGDLLIHKGLYLFAFILSLYVLYRMSASIILIALPCSIIYGIISIAQTKQVERRQEGAE